MQRLATRAERVEKGMDEVELEFVDGQNSWRNEGVFVCVRDNIIPYRFPRIIKSKATFSNPTHALTKLLIVES